MSSDELYAIDPEYRKWRDAQDIIRARLFEFAYTCNLAPACCCLCDPRIGRTNDNPKV